MLSKICYICGKEGHIKHDCWVKVTCSRCGKSGHIKKNCWVKLHGAEANATHQDSDAPKWEQCFSIEVIDQPENMTSLTHPGDSIDYENDWIVDFGCSYHARGHVNLLSNVKSHEGKGVIVTTDNSLHPIMKEGKFEGNCTLKDAYHVPGLKKNLAFVSQITNSDKYVLFCPKDVKFFDNLKDVDVDVLVTGKKKNSLYVVSISDVYVQKTSRNTSPSV